MGAREDSSRDLKKKGVIKLKRREKKKKQIIEKA